MSAAITTEQASKSKARPRSERVAEVFNFSPYPYQASVLDAPAREVSWVCGRQVGKTETAGVIPADYALTHENEDVLIAARFQETANELFRRTKKHLENTGIPLSTLGVTSPNKTTYEFANGCRILSRTLGTNADQQRGKLPSCVIVEEAALVDDEIYERVIEPMFATHDDYELYLISTPRGKRGYLYDKHVHDDDWSSFHVATSASPLVSEEWLEQKRKKTDDITWRQEYLGEFVESDDAYLPRSVVAPCVASRPVEQVEQPEGIPCWLGVDVARSGRDRSVFLSIAADGTVFDVRARDKQSVPEAVADIRALNHEYDYYGILIDENAVGGGVVDFAAEDIPHVEPVTFSQKSKQAMFQTLKRALEQGDITLPEHEQLTFELTDLQYSYTGNGILKVGHPPGGRDDYADATALAVYGWKQRLGGPSRTTRDGSGPVQSRRERSSGGATQNRTKR